MEDTRYTSIAVALHWAIAILILGQIAGGFYMHNLPNTSSIKFDLYQLHKSFGLSILLLTFIRFGWRLMNRPPALPVAMPGWQKAAARVTHWGFYALMVFTPLAGWAMVSVSPTDIPTRLFGVLPVPHLPFLDGVTDRAASEDMLKETHEVLAKGILLLLALHIGAAIKHSIVDRDRVLASMLPSRANQWAGILVVLGFLSTGAVIYMVAPPPQAKAAATAISQATTEANWTVDYGASRLAFIGQEKGAAFEGEFSDFQASINFDPENIATSSIRVTVGTESASTGDSLRDSTIPAKEWFHVADHPTAEFVADDIQATDENNYEATGVLRIKDYEQSVTVTFMLDIDGDTALATGGADLVRTNFGLGLDDSWLNDEEIGLEVRVEFEIHATRT
ncbi:MAG: cytochrome b/b6 domain-containing protein [Pseudomonadota bacterium]